MSVLMFLNLDIYISRFTAHTYGSGTRAVH